MKIEIKQNILMEALNHVIKGISSKNLIPILNCIKFELKKEGLYLSSTDNDISIQAFIDKDDIETIDSLGEIVVSGRYIYEIIRKLPNEIVKIEEIIDNKIDIRTKSSNFTLNCNIVSEFPIIDVRDSKVLITLDRIVFKNLIRQTAFASSQQEARPTLTGINFKISSNTLEVGATDSFRVSKKKIELENNNKQDINIIIPTKNLNELMKLIIADEGNIELHIFENKIMFKFDNLIMISRLINGEFPDLSKLIPDNFSLSMKINLHQFYSSLDRASLFTSESDKNIVTLESKNNNILITSNIPEIGHVEENVEVEKDCDKEINISFSSKYMMEAIRAIDGDDIELQFSGELKPIIIRNSNDDNLVQLIVPIRTN